MVAPDILLARHGLDPASAIERSGRARNSSASGRLATGLQTGCLGGPELGPSVWERECQEALVRVAYQARRVRS